MFDLPPIYRQPAQATTMAKKRVGTVSGRRSNRVQPSQNDQPTDSPNSRSNSTHKPIAIFAILLLCLSVAISMIVYYRRLHDSRTVTTPSYVYRGGLLKTDVNYHEILTENAKVPENATGRHFKYPVLAYITPWNSKGYKLAKKFNSKLTHVSPVWYDLKSQGTKLVLEGRHNADGGWISDVRMEGHAQILPRIVLEANPVDLLTKKKQQDKAIKLIIKECKEMDYDGIVLESWSRWAGYGILHDAEMRNMALQFVKKLGQAMHSVMLERNSEQSLQLIYVIGPPRSQKLQEHDFGPEDLLSLSDAVDGYSLMTYDFSSPHSPGPNAPLRWVRSTMHMLLDSNNGATNLAKKIFVGINFYGNDFILSGGLGGGPIVGREYLSLLEQHKPLLQWEKDSAEHFFLYSDSQNAKHVVFYPSLMSFAVRLEEATSWGAGISIWEIGQGLDHFFGLL